MNVRLAMEFIPYKQLRLSLFLTQKCWSTFYPLDWMVPKSYYMLKQNVPRVVRENPTIWHIVWPIFQPCWKDATASTGIPNKTTIVSARIKFIRSILNSVLNYKKLGDFLLCLFSVQLTINILQLIITFVLVHSFTHC